MIYRPKIGDVVTVLSADSWINAQIDRKKAAIQIKRIKLRFVSVLQIECNENIRGEISEILKLVGRVRLKDWVVDQTVPDFAPEELEYYDPFGYREK